MVLYPAAFFPSKSKLAFSVLSWWLMLKPKTSRNCFFKKQQPWLTLGLMTCLHELWVFRSTYFFVFPLIVVIYCTPVNYVVACEEDWRCMCVCVCSQDGWILLRRSFSCVCVFRLFCPCDANICLRDFRKIIVYVLLTVFHRTPSHVMLVFRQNCLSPSSRIENAEICLISL